MLPVCAEKTPAAVSSRTRRSPPFTPTVQCCSMRARWVLQRRAFISHTPHAFGGTTGSTLMAGGGGHRNSRVSRRAFFSHTPESDKCSFAMFVSVNAVALDTSVFAIRRFGFLRRRARGASQFACVGAGVLSGFHTPSASGLVVWRGFGFHPWGSLEDN